MTGMITSKSLPHYLSRLPTQRLPFMTCEGKSQLFHEHIIVLFPSSDLAVPGRSLSALQIGIAAEALRRGQCGRLVMPETATRDVLPLLESLLHRGRRRAVIVTEPCLREGLGAEAVVRALLTRCGADPEAASRFEAVTTVVPSSWITVAVSTGAVPPPASMSLPWAPGAPVRPAASSPAQGERESLRDIEAHCRSTSAVAGAVSAVQWPPAPEPPLSAQRQWLEGMPHSPLRDFAIRDERARLSSAVLAKSQAQDDALPVTSVAPPPLVQPLPAAHLASSLSTRYDERLVPSEVRGGFLPVFFGGSNTPAPVGVAEGRPMGYADQADDDADEACGDGDVPVWAPIHSSRLPPPAPTAALHTTPIISHFANDSMRRQLRRIDERRPFAVQQAPPGPLDTSLPEDRAAKEADAAPNKALLDELARLKAVYESTGDHWRQYAYNRAIGIIKRLPTAVTSGAEIRDMPGIGEKIANKIDEIIATGTTRKLGVLRGQRGVQMADVLTKAWGIGPSCAQKIAAERSPTDGSFLFNTLQDVLARPPSYLSASQRTGLAHYDDLLQRIPRPEVELIGAHVCRALERLGFHISQASTASFLQGEQPAARGTSKHPLDVVICGSYRRGKADSGDVDVLICDRTARRSEGILPLLLEELRHSAFVCATLTNAHKTMEGGADTWFGVVQLPDCGSPAQQGACPCSHRPPTMSVGVAVKQEVPEPAVASDDEDTKKDVKRFGGPITPFSSGCHLSRRLDIKVYPADQFPFAVLYFTGSDYFNRSMRLYCHKRGLSLSDHGLTHVVRVKRERIHEGGGILCQTERDVFDAIGLPYRHPHERDL